VSFEIARRHRYHREMAEIPNRVEAHVLPAGGSSQDDNPLAYRDFAKVERHIAASYAASRAYLAEQDL